MSRCRDRGQCPAEFVLHLRRLDGFLKDQGLHHTAEKLEMESGLFFKATHLQQLVRQGRWAAANSYLRFFSALWEGERATHYTALRQSLANLATLASLACRGKEGGRAAALLKPPDDAYLKAYPEFAQRRALFCSMTSQQARASVNWEEIKLRALERVQELIHPRPDLECMLSNRLLQHVPTPQDTIPLGLRGCRKHLRKRVGRKPARDLAYFLRYKRMPCSQKINHSGDPLKAKNSLTRTQGHTSEWNCKGAKLARYEDARYTQHGQENFDSRKDTKRPRTAAD